MYFIFKEKDTRLYIYLKMTTPENILEVKTVQSGAFRILVEALKEILTDANLEFDQSGLKIMAMDSSHTVLVHLKLHSDNFEHYFITKDRVVLGVNMINFFKLKQKCIGRCWFN